MLWTLLLLLACETSVEPSDDRDGDGTADSEDCDASDPSRFPGNPEVCDGVDNNCDDVVDEGLLSTFYTDADLDGFGDPASPVEACSPAAGVVVDSSDCDDSSDAVHPDATEVCSGVDNDCDPATLEDEGADAGVWFADDDADGFGTGDGQRACSQPEGTADQSGDCDDSAVATHPDAVEVCANGIDEDCAGGADDGCPAIEHCGDITVDETWPAGAHLVTCTITVRDGATLTLTEGASVQFEPATGFIVGAGVGGHIVSTDVDPATPVLLTSSSTTPAAGDWTGIAVRSVGTVTLAGATLEYAGGSQGALTVDGVLTLDGSTVQHSSGVGVFVGTDATAAIRNSMIVNNGGHGVEVSLYGELASDGVGFANNEVSGNAGAGVRLMPEQVGLLRASSTYVGNASGVRVATGTVTRSATWDGLDAGLIVEGPVVIGHSDDPVVTLLAGLTIEMEPAANLSVGRQGAGGLRVEGTDADPVAFLGDGTAGSWAGLRFGNRTSVAELSHLAVEDAGSSSAATAAAIEFEGVVGAELSGVSVVRSARRGIHAHTATVLSLVDSTVQDCTEAGVELDHTSRIDGAVGFSGNTLTQSAVPLRLNPEAVADLGSNVLTGNTLDAIELSGPSVRTSGTWQPWGVPYLVEQGFNIQEGAVVTMTAGTELHMEAGQSIVVGGFGPGGLVADGLTVRSASATPAAGDWGGIVFQNRCIASSSAITNATVLHGAHSPRFAAVEFNGCDGSISNTLIAESALHGVFVSLNTNASVGSDVVCSNVAGDCQHFD